MKSSGYLAILATCLCGQFSASAQAPSNQTTNSTGPMVFVFSGGSFSQFVDALTKHFGTNFTQMLDWPANEPRMRIPKMRVGPTSWIGVLKTYNTISQEGDGFLGKWVYSPPFSNDPASLPQTLVFIPPKTATPESLVQVRAFPIRGMPTATINKLREAIENQAGLIRRHLDDGSAIRGEVNVHEGTGLLVAVGGKTYVELVGTLVDAFNTNFPYPRP